ncbi:thiol:disulfide interchange protein DsbA/DsbL [Luteimonas sp. RD2P54]|uniref:Thiol:disulfide interchange protein DsbA/DsbL n=1 Tax=Luteimonas endophytica TaxID=3042023 RepID=A0ABT6JCP9_9GAMM|nr:thiol:disulfide interchange protein DsbA/DsbL [Luteimonas endophytica]MDH5824606.1 thiol:disulfide interchange protein DsbA/DsbL [Luteimonas endophytica]
MTPIRRWPLAALAVLMLWAGAAQAQPAPVEGQDYVTIADGAPWAADGRIEVVEIFSYACHICDELHPMVEAWRGRLADDVRFEYLPVVYRRQDAFATAFFAAQALRQLPRVHGATFDAVHRGGDLARNASTAELAWFYAQQGVDRGALERAMADAATGQKLNAAREFLLRSGAEGTPTFIIDGRYRVQARSLRDLLRITDQLIAMVRAERSRTGTLPTTTRPTPP